MAQNQLFLLKRYGKKNQFDSASKTPLDPPNRFILYKYNKNQRKGRDVSVICARGYHHAKAATERRFIEHNALRFSKKKATTSAIISTSAGDDSGGYLELHYLAYMQADHTTEQEIAREKDLLIEWSTFTAVLCIRNQAWFNRVVAI